MLACNMYAMEATNTTNTSSPARQENGVGETDEGNDMRTLDGECGSLAKE